MKQAAELLQQAGIAAGALQDCEDLMDHDPQIATRGALVTLDHPLLAMDGPNWYRGAALCREASERDVLDPLLRQFGVEDERVRDTALGVATKLAAGSPTALAFTKHALHNWLRLAGPSFDASLALEFLGFRLGDVREGLDAVRDRRPPKFDR